MALLTERALKRHPVAVITVETPLADIDKGNFDADFEWFRTVDAAKEWAEQWMAFAEADAKEFADADGEDAPIAYLTILVSDTDALTVESATVAPKTAAVTAWKKTVLADLTMLFVTPDEKPKPKAVVKAPRRKAVVVGGKASESEPPAVKGRRVKIKVGDDE